MKNIISPKVANNKVMTQDSTELTEKQWQVIKKIRTASKEAETFV